MTGSWGWGEDWGYTAAGNQVGMAEVLVTGSWGCGEDWGYTAAGHQVGMAEV